MRPPVDHYFAALIERLFANVTREWFLSRIRSTMYHQMTLLTERLFTHITQEQFFSRVRPPVGR